MLLNVGGYGSRIALAEPVIGPAKGRTRWLTCPGRQVEPSSPGRVVNLHRRFAMRVFLGMILVALLLVAVVYLYVSQSTSTEANAKAVPAIGNVVDCAVA